MLKKYNELLDMFRKDDYNVDQFECIGEHESYVTDANSEYSASIYLEDDIIEVYICDEDGECVESKRYINIKFAYNFIKRYL